MEKSTKSERESTTDGGFGSAKLQTSTATGANTSESSIAESDTKREILLRKTQSFYERNQIREKSSDTDEESKRAEERIRRRESHDKRQDIRMRRAASMQLASIRFEGEESDESSTERFLGSQQARELQALINSIPIRGGQQEP
ncbi:hypothetical protein B9Z55_026295 [Caenorhabditis nigoni]|uniref:Uncharacterized protein n=1 Tax=Caenorhabditis nigoni TaxID=1611254 RepID=A0A2G5T2H1_9PELO|nr:hypothetical protein B9Z55_026295 [Caenorhabditis nigoni]